MKTTSVAGLAWLLVLAAANAPLAQTNGPQTNGPQATGAAAIGDIPDWLFPLDPNAGKTPAPRNDVELLGIPDSTATYTDARINNPFLAPDWHPDAHIAMPEIVARGRKPHVMACAYCHTPTGQGRPENSALAGLSAAYIKEQLTDMRSGARQPVGPATYLPYVNMYKLAAQLTDAEIEASAAYFAQQKLGRRVYVIEGLRLPRVEPVAWIYIENPSGGMEDIDGRVIEVAPDLTRHERRDDRMIYTAYVPPGSIARGKRLVTTGKDEVSGATTQACAACHGGNLKGLQDVPPIAGRSPTYLTRQMLAFKLGKRAGPGAKPMQPVVETLAVGDMVAIAAYVATLPP